MTKTELISLLEDAYVKMDLLQEALDERTEENRALKGQLMNLLKDHRYPDLKTG